MTRTHRHFELCLFTRKFCLILQIETFFENCASVSLLCCPSHIFELSAFLSQSFAVKNQYLPKYNFNARTVLVVICKTEAKTKWNTEMNKLLAKNYKVHYILFQVLFAFKICPELVKFLSVMRIAVFYVLLLKKLWLKTIVNLQFHLCILYK